MCRARGVYARECGACGETLGHAIDAGMREFVRVEVQFTFLSKEDTVPCRKAIAADHLPPVSFTMICLSSARASSTTWPPTGCIRAVELLLDGGAGWVAVVVRV